MTTTRSPCATACRGHGFGRGTLHSCDINSLTPTTRHNLGRRLLDHPFTGADDSIQFLGLGEKDEQVVILLLDVK